MKSSFPHKRVSPRRAAGPSPARRRRATNRLPLTWVAFISRVVSFSRVVSLGVLTVVGWAVVNSIGTLPSSVPSEPRLTARVFPANDPAGDPLFTGVLAPADSRATEEVVASQSPLPLSPLHSVAKANNVVQATGTQIRINGETLPGLWQQKNGRIGVASASLANLLGAELLSTTSVSQQPIRWFPASQESVVTLPAWWDATNRYIDISDLAATGGWTGQAAGNVLQLSVPAQQTLAIRQGRQTWGDRVVDDLTGPATWQMEVTDVYTITVGGEISTEMVRAFQAMPGNLITQLHVAPLSGKTVIKIKTKDGASPQIWTAGNPAKVVIDIRRDAMVERDIAWAPGLRWRQQYISVGQHRFPVYMFITRPNPQTLALRPINANPNAATGIEPILSTAQRQQVTGAVNAGFFNRNNQLPLGAVRRGGQWISGPILGRGAMAWNDRGDLVMDRFALAESVAASGQTYSILAVNGIKSNTSRVKATAGCSVGIAIGVDPSGSR